MTTKFRVIRGAVGESDQLAEQANQAIAEIESNGGKYIDSHWSTAGPTGSGHLVGTLVIVYKEGPSEETSLDLEEYYRNQ